MMRLFAGLLTLGLAACASAPQKSPSSAIAVPGAGTIAVATLPAGAKKSPYAPAQEDLGKRGHYQAGGLYAPHIADSTPDLIPDVDAIPEPEVTREPRSRVGNRSSYTVLGQQYRVLDDATQYVEQGLASYYGNKFHGRRTSNLEVYDMYAFTAAHKTLPLPSFARVTNLDNGKSVTVRVNDRGPFHAGRVIDLSYSAAVKLGITQRGTGRVEVRALTPGNAAPLLAGAGERAPAQWASRSAAPSTLDKLVAAMPIASAAAGELPPGVRIATGRPMPVIATAAPPLSTTVYVASSAPKPPSDANIAATSAAVAAPTAPVAGAPVQANVRNDYRFDMRQDGKAMSADEFEAWMKSRRVRVATGRPSIGLVAGGAGTTNAADAGGTAIARTPTVDVAFKPAATAVTLASSELAGDVTLQVASFSARDNADRALAMLHGAGIGDARLNDANANGQQVWRLRVGPLNAATAPELTARIVGLGFGTPQRVRN